MDVFLTSLGCRLNEAELQTWTRQLTDSGHRVVTAADQAQLLVLNTCAVTSDASRSSRQLARRLHRSNPSAKLILTGCFAELEPDQAATQLGVDRVISNRNKDRLVDLLSEELETTMPAAATAPDSAAPFAAAKTRGFVKIQDGCKNQCTFCIVTVARGEERSRPVSEIVKEVQRLCQDGIQEVVLTGVHIGGYGSDIQTTLHTLLSALLEHTDIPRIRIGSLEPWNLIPSFFSLWSQSNRLCPHLHLPLQSGSDPVLRRMARHCTVQQYQQLVHHAREGIPDLHLTTDLITGFPGETDAEHAQTLQTIRQIGFGHMHVFAYSTRAGTPAARMKNSVPKKVKRSRSREIHDIASMMKQEDLSRRLGQRRPVLWESVGPSLTDSDPVWLGYTDTYHRVELAGPATVSRNTVHSVQLDSVLEGKRFQVRL